MQRLRSVPLVVNGSILNGSAPSTSSTSVLATTSTNNALVFQSKLEANSNAVRSALKGRKLVSESPRPYSQAHLSHHLKQQQMMNTTLFAGSSTSFTLSPSCNFSEYLRSFSTNNKKSDDDATNESVAPNVIGEEESTTPKKGHTKNRPKREPADIVLERTTPSVYELAEENPSVPRITHAELNQLLQTNNQNTVLVDLREPEWIEGEPRLKGAVSFPVSPLQSGVEDQSTQVLRSAMEMTPQQFEKKYSFPKFDVNSQQHVYVFYSNTGKRSEKLVQVASEELGFKNVKSLLGGARLFNKYYNPEGKEQQSL